MGQSMTLSPAQIQVVKLLEVPYCDMSKRINEELEENPALEEYAKTPSQAGEEDMGYDSDTDNESMSEREQGDDLSSYIQSEEQTGYTDRGGYSSDDDDDEPVQKELSSDLRTSFGEYLKSQVYLTKMSKPERHIAKFIVWSIDEDGYLKMTDEQIADQLAFQENLIISEQEIHDIVAQIQQFDPAGVGAHDLRECLLIQLRSKHKNEAIEDAIRIICDGMDLFQNHHYDKLKERLEIDDDRLRNAKQEIAKLNPKPGSAWNGTLYERHQLSVIPDFRVTNEDDGLKVILFTGDIPQLRVSEEYNNMLIDYTSNAANQTNKNKEAVQFIKSKIDAAKWFIDAIRQRNETLRKTMTAIVKLQKDYFQEGDISYLHPLRLQDVAEETGLDVSTISRVCNSKFVDTDFGIKPLKFFFSEKMTNADGDEISNKEIKEILTQCIKDEDKTHPLTDDELVKVMEEQGYKVARRTIAKYRDQLNIPVARLRKDV